MRLPIFIPALLLLQACGTTGVASRADREPPAEFGRPGWVRGTAGFGGWIGGVLGGVVSVVVLPITYPITLVCDDGIGDSSRNEVLLWPVSAFATAGHFVLGTPPDVVDFVVRRAWVRDEAKQNPFEHIPAEPASGSTGEKD
jgi:hypothetical protein